MGNGTRGMAEECYVCADDGGSERVYKNLCLCTDRGIHLSCQRRLLETCAGVDCRCAVCNGPYVNATVRIERPINPRAACLYLAGFACVGACGVAALAFVVYYSITSSQRTVECVCDAWTNETVGDNSSYASTLGAAACREFVGDRGLCFHMTNLVNISFHFLFMTALAVLSTSVCVREIVNRVRGLPLRDERRRVTVVDVASGTRSLETASPDAACV